MLVSLFVEGQQGRSMDLGQSVAIAQAAVVAIDRRGDESQQLLMVPTVQVDANMGFFGKLTLLPSALSPCRTKTVANCTRYCRLI